MKRRIVASIVTTGIFLLLALNLAFKVRAQVPSTPGPEDKPKIQYRVVRVDPSTNQDLLFRQAGEQGLEFAGTIEVAGNTGYIIFKK